jgi:hypothetical protein
MAMMVILGVNVVIVLRAIHVRIFDASPAIAIVLLIKVIVANLKGRSSNQALGPGPATIRHLIRAVVAKHAQVLGMPVLQLAAGVGVAAGDS